MKIIINGKHAEKLNTELEIVQKRSRVRTISGSEVVEILSDVTQKLQIPKSRMKNIEVFYSGAEHFPSSYKYIPESTHFKAVHNGRYWVVTNISRRPCPNRLNNIRLIMPDDARKAILKNHTDFRI